MGEISKSTKGLKFMQRAAAAKAAASAQSNPSTTGSTTLTTPSNSSTLASTSKSLALSKDIKKEVRVKVEKESVFKGQGKGAGENEPVERVKMRDVQSDAVVIVRGAKGDGSHPHRTFIVESSTLSFPSISSTSSSISNSAFSFSGRQTYGSMSSISNNPGPETSTSANDSNESYYHRTNPSTQKLPLKVLAKGVDPPKKKIGKRNRPLTNMKEDSSIRKLLKKEKEEIKMKIEEERRDDVSKSKSNSRDVTSKGSIDLSRERERGDGGFVKPKVGIEKGRAVVAERMVRGALGRSSHVREEEEEDDQSEEEEEDDSESEKEEEEEDESVAERETEEMIQASRAKRVRFS